MIIKRSTVQIATIVSDEDNSVDDAKIQEALDKAAADTKKVKSAVIVTKKVSEGSEN